MWILDCTINRVYITHAEKGKECFACSDKQKEPLVKNRKKTILSTHRKVFVGGKEN